MNPYEPPHSLVLATEWVVNFGFWTMIAFFVVTTCVWPWWKSFWGVNIVSLELSIGLALLPSTLSLDFDFSRLTSAAGAWLQVGAVFLASCVVIWRGVLIIHDQLKGAQVTPLRLWRAALGSLARRLWPRPRSRTDA